MNIRLMNKRPFTNKDLSKKELQAQLYNALFFLNDLEAMYIDLWDNPTVAIEMNKQRDAMHNIELTGYYEFRKTVKKTEDSLTKQVENYDIAANGRNNRTK